MGYLTDFLNKILEFFEIKPVEPVVPEEPPKPREPAEAERPLPPKEPIEPVEEPVEPLPIGPVEPSPIGEEGKRRRIEKPPAEPEEPEDYPARISFFVREITPEGEVPVVGADVTFLGQTKTTDHTGQCEISGRMKVMKSYPITASKAGYKTTHTEISFAFAPRSGVLGATKILYMERL